MNRPDPRRHYEVRRLDPRHEVIINPILNRIIPVRIKRDGKQIMERHLDLDFRGLL